MRYWAASPGGASPRGRPAAVLPAGPRTGGGVNHAPRKKNPNRPADGDRGHEHRREVRADDPADATDGRGDTRAGGPYGGRVELRRVCVNDSPGAEVEERKERGPDKRVRTSAGVAEHECRASRPKQV